MLYLPLLLALSPASCIGFFIEKAFYLRDVRQRGLGHTNVNSSRIYSHGSSSNTKLGTMAILIDMMVLIIEMFLPTTFIITQ